MNFRSSLLAITGLATFMVCGCARAPGRAVAGDTPIDHVEQACASIGVGGRFFSRPASSTHARQRTTLQR